MPSALGTAIDSAAMTAAVGISASSNTDLDQHSPNSAPTCRPRRPARQRSKIDLHRSLGATKVAARLSRDGNVRHDAAVARDRAVVGPRRRRRRHGGVGAIVGLCPAIRANRLASSESLMST
ncbi:hypothetical protein [Actinomadura sp. NBRC 104412]|uniref:hypothetical protein n=1 Tax=Actinomadura sp. NBRC 104412 TaxID=3032203 RepID=UPI002556B95C|nr:hypothetical protein [Actinomadura sp. NBRC 104412]